MAYKFIQFDNGLEMTDYLNGIIVGKNLDMTPLNLDGLTLTIDAGLVTFSGTELRLPDVVTQINAVKAGAASLRNYGHSAPPKVSLAFVIDGNVLLGAGTANAILGLPVVDTTVGAGAVAKADIVSIFAKDTNRFGVVHE